MTNFAEIRNMDVTPRVKPYDTPAQQYSDFINSHWPLVTEHGFSDDDRFARRTGIFAVDCVRYADAVQEHPELEPHLHSLQEMAYNGLVHMALGDEDRVQAQLAHSRQLLAEFMA